VPLRKERLNLAITTLQQLDRIENRGSSNKDEWHVREAGTTGLELLRTTERTRL